MSERQREQVKLPGDRCPYCHEEVARSDVDKVACNACMAWHHAPCWQEHGACSACGAERTGLSEASPLKAGLGVQRWERPPGLWITGIGLLFVIPLVTFLTLWAYNDNIEIISEGTWEIVLAFSVFVGAFAGVGCMIAALKRHRIGPKAGDPNDVDRKQDEPMR